MSRKNREAGVRLGLWAVACFCALLISGPAFADAESQIKLEEAKVMFTDGDYGGALARLDEVVQAEPDNGLAYHYAGLCQIGLGKPEAALPLLEKTVELLPADGPAWEDLAWAYVSSQKNDEALAAAEKALAINPQSPRAMLYQGHALFGLGRHEEALTAFKALAENAEYKQVGLFYAGLSLLQLGRTEEALPYFEQAHQVDPDTELGRKALEFATALGGSEAARPERPWGVELRLLYQYDTNIVPVNNEDYLPEEVSNMEDGRMVVDLDLKYNFIDAREGRATARYMGYASWHGQEQEVNLMYHRGELSGFLNLPVGPGMVRPGIVVNYAIASLDNEPYSALWKASPEVSLVWGPTLRTRLVMDLFGETFDDPGDDVNNRDNTGISGALYQHFYLFEGKVNTWLGYRYSQITAEGDNYNRLVNAGMAGMIAALPGDALLILTGRYEDRQYPDSSFDREEQRTIGNLIIQVPVYKWVNLYGGLVYTNVDANLELLEYERWIYTGGVMLDL